MSGNSMAVVEWEGQKFCSVSSVAKECGVSASYIRAEIARKKLPAFRDQKGWLYVAAESVEAFKKRRERRFEPVVK